MIITAKTEIEIEAGGKAIWEYSSAPENWTASNPTEHFGLEFFNAENRPKEGTTFHQREKVAGVFADLRGQVVYLDYPKTMVWNGIAQYKVLKGLLKVSVNEGGLIKLREAGGGTTRFSHDVFMHFPNSIWGKLWHFLFKNAFSAEKKVYNHTYRELQFFKNKLEARPVFNDPKENSDE